MKQEMINRIQEVSEDATVTPSAAVWDKLEQRLEADKKAIAPPPKSFSLFSMRKWSIAASVMVLVGAYGLLNNLGQPDITSSVVQLEDLHTLEVNPRHVSPIGESSTIPSIHMTSYDGIDEGKAEKKLKMRNVLVSNVGEYGLG